jgi:hypothetical protein
MVNIVCYQPLSTAFPCYITPIQVNQWCPQRVTDGQNRTKTREQASLLQSGCFEASSSYRLHRQVQNRDRLGRRFEQRSLGEGAEWSSHHRSQSERHLQRTERIRLQTESVTGSPLPTQRIKKKSRQNDNFFCQFRNISLY